MQNSTRADAGVERCGENRRVAVERGEMFGCAERTQRHQVPLGYRGYRESLLRIIAEFL
jgi:hypothetical protein